MTVHRIHFIGWASRIAAACFIAVCLSGWTPSTLLAQTITDEETESCVSCHSEESAAWELSAHGSVHPESSGEAGGASCIDCHGEYIKGHPAEGPMSLKVDSSSCQDCHADTFEQWHDSLHASEGVQCISCHKVHSQQLRLTDETLCQSCHRESVNDPFHTAHWEGDATCTSCHLSEIAPIHSVEDGEQVIRIAAIASHDFTAVSGAKCLDCHSSDVTEVRAQPLAAATVPVVSAATPTPEPSLLASASLSIANLGFGLGIGGILGIIFMLVIATLGFGKKES